MSLMSREHPSRCDFPISARLYLPEAWTQEVISDFGVRLLDEMVQAEAEQVWPVLRMPGQCNMPRTAPHHDAESDRRCSARRILAARLVAWREPRPFVQAVHGSAGSCRDRLCSPELQPRTQLGGS